MKESIAGFSLISSAKIRGTHLYSLNTIEGQVVDGSKPKHIGVVEYFLIDRVKGQVVYLVTSFGGFLGLGEGHYRVPWESVKYKSDLDGYITGLTVEQMRANPENWDS